MKKVYGCSNYLFLLVFGLLGFSFLITYESLVKGKPFGSYGWMLLISSAVVFLYFLRTLISPLWIYDEEGFELIRLFWKTTEKHQWSEVTKIKCSTSAPSLFTVWYGNYQTLWMGYIFNRDQKKVLTDVVLYVQKNNPKAKIYGTALKMAGVKDVSF
jgi:hypothetical protein